MSILHLALLQFLIILAAPLWGIAGSHDSRPPFPLPEALVHRKNPNSAREEPSLACKSTYPASRFPFCNQSLSVRARVKDLLPRLTLEEKIFQLGHESKAVDRLGIPAYNWWNEALHGVASSPGVSFGGSVPCATSFPQVIGTAASFNRSLWKAIGQVISTEARAMSNVGRAGLTFWTPNVNIFRDPRWGRGQETPGEDPYLSSEYAAQFVSGLQDVEESTDLSRSAEGGVENGYLKASACCKHVVAYDLENWNGTDRFHFDAQVTALDMEDTYLPPFRSCFLRARASGAMCAYNRVNGVPACARGDLLTDTIRRKWDFIGYVTSDCGAVSIIKSYTHYAPTPEDAVADTISAGMDLNCGTYVQSHASSAVKKGKLSASQVDDAVSRLTAVRMRLGLFDGEAPRRPFAGLGPDLVHAPAHRKLAIEAARQSLVLLKNDRSTLPWPRQRGTTGRQLSIAFIGPHANASLAMLGNYAGVPCGITTPLHAAFSRASVTHATGCADMACNSDQGFAAAAAVSRRADRTVVFVGLDQLQESEGHDRVSLLLPGRQEALIAQVAAACRGPLTVVVMGGGPVDLSSAKSDDRVGAILWVGYPGEAGGQAIVDVLFGDYNPSGRLPVTWYPKEFERVSMFNMAMRPNRATGYPGRTYRFYTGNPIFPFGHGLSYTRFAYSELRAPASVSFSPQPCARPTSGLLSSARSYPPAESAVFEVSFTVTNVGERSGDETVLLYMAALKPKMKGDAEKTLVEFQKLHMLKGESKVVKFKFKVRVGVHIFADWEKWSLRPGTYRLIVGDRSFEFEVMQRPCYDVQKSGVAL